MNNQNQALLQEVNHARVWFSARKTKPLWARLVEVGQTVTSPEGDLEAKPGDYLCRGVAGEFWVQAEDTLLAKYVQTAQSSQDVDGLIWAQYVPRPEASGVMAAQISHPFEVHSSWGILSGKEGDYLLKRLDERENDSPSDLWMVDKAVFESTYQRSSD